MRRLFPLVAALLLCSCSTQFWPIVDPVVVDPVVVDPVVDPPQPTAGVATWDKLELLESEGSVKSPRVRELLGAPVEPLKSRLDDVDPTKRIDHHRVLLKDGKTAVDVFVYYDAATDAVFNIRHG